MYTFYLLLFAWLAYVLSVTIRAIRTKVPGPWYTNLTSFVLKYFEFQGKRRVWIHKLHETYGPVVRLAPNEVAFANLEGMKEIYQSGGSGYDKTEFYNLFKQYGRRPMFALMNKNEHSQRRKLFAERYAMTNIMSSSIMHGIQQNAEKVVQKCLKSTGSYLDTYTVLHCYALDCASHALFNPAGTKSLDEKEDYVLMEDLSYDNRLRSRLVQHHWPALASIRYCFTPKPMMSLSHKFVLDRVSHSKTEDSSLLYKLRSKSENLEKVQMAAECMDHLAAGIDTTGDALCFLMYELSLPRSQEIQQCLRQEIMQNPGARLDDLPYMDAVIKEGLRLFPPIPMSLPRYVPREGRTISGYQLPGSSIVSCQAYSMHLMDDTVFPSPSKFIPERWLEKDGELERNRLFFAFAAGGRGCIGKNLALVEMKTLLRRIYGRFETEVALEMKSDMSIDDQIIASRPKDQKCLLTFREVTH
ncbi:hypothetical protein N7532_009382 [Penicillium argentinense]|uniref:Cytochrome P450 n=1 Tax=Penicillium argentinense TaxID=1131581 RepID=A0A9W9EZ77_9EURO|nr:uncharacterized protein N7532_009382 [Penicillium argentinense]KAJ5090698.1 hypothetical protein N7532_009382 [Penicillium argentinense]